MKFLLPFLGAWLIVACPSKRPSPTSTEALFLPRPHYLFSQPGR